MTSPNTIIADLVRESELMIKQRDFLIVALNQIAANVGMYHPETIEQIARDAITNVREMQIIGYRSI